MKRSINAILLVAGLFLTFLVFYNIGLWWLISSDSCRTFDEIKSEYRSHYPHYLQNLTLFTLIDFLMSVIASLCFFKLNESVSFRIASIFKALAILHIILASWFIFTLM